MKTKKVTLSKSSASFSTAASHVVEVSLVRAPWEPEPEVQAPTPEEKEDKGRGPRHLGPYTRNRKS